MKARGTDWVGGAEQWPWADHWISNRYLGKRFKRLALSYHLRFGAIASNTVTTQTLRRERAHPLYIFEPII